MRDYLKHHGCSVWGEHPNNPSLTRLSNCCLLFHFHLLVWLEQLHCKWQTFPGVQPQTAFGVHQGIPPHLKQAITVLWQSGIFFLCFHLEYHFLPIEYNLMVLNQRSCPPRLNLAHAKPLVPLQNLNSEQSDVVHPHWIVTIVSISSLDFISFFFF